MLCFPDFTDFPNNQQKLVINKGSYINLQGIDKQVTLRKTSQLRYSSNVQCRHEKIAGLASTLIWQQVDLKYPLGEIEYILVLPLAHCVIK